MAKRKAKTKAAPSRRSVKGSSAPKRSPALKRRPRNGTRRWSQSVTDHSDALTLDRNVFTLSDPKQIAASLKRSAERSRRRKSSSYRSAMSMLTFYINRAGKSLPAKRRHVLERAKDALRHAFGRE